MADVFSYLDYRCFLKDAFFCLKRDRQSFSYRNFNRKAGFSSSGYLKLIMDRKRNLAPEGIFKVCKGLGLSSEEARYFESLVKMNQAVSSEEKDHYFKELTKLPSTRTKNSTVISQYKMFSHWYLIAILELVRLDDFKNDPIWISKKLSPKVTPAKISKAINELLQLGFIKKCDDGNLQRVDQMISTPEEVRDVSLFNFHHQMIEVAKEALNKHPAAERDFSTLTIALSPDGFKKLKTMIQEFRKNVHSILETGNDSKTIVAHINMQLFKLTNGGSL